MMISGLAGSQTVRWLQRKVPGLYWGEMTQLHIYWAEINCRVTNKN